MKRQPAGSKKGGQFAPDTRGKTPPASASPERPRPVADADPSEDTSAYEAYVAARFALPLADDLRSEVQTALDGSPWADRGLNAGRGSYTPEEAGVIAAALNHRLMVWPTETSRGPDAAVIRSLFVRFSAAARGENPAITG